MEKLTLKEALEFSIKKWEAVVENDGVNIGYRQKQKLGIYNFVGAWNKLRHAFGAH